MTLYELQVWLTELWPNYELQVGWNFTKTGTEYYAKWRPELRTGVETDWIVECDGPAQAPVFNVLVERARTWKEEFDASARELAREG